MPSESRYKEPLTSFAPQLMQTWLAATSRRLIFRSKNRSELVSLQHRMNHLRRRMREEGHEHWELVYGATSSLKQERNDDGFYELHFFPRDSQFGKLFKQEGIETKEIPTDILDDL